MKPNFFCKDRIVATVCFAGALWVYLAAEKFPMSIIDAMGSAMYPQILAVLFGVASIVMFITAKPSKQELEVAAAKAAKAAGEDVEIPKNKGWRSVFFIFGTLWIYYFLFKPLGFPITNFLFCLGFTLFFDKRPIKQRLLWGAVFAAVFTVLMYLLFKVVLHVMLPTLLIGR